MEAAEAGTAEKKLGKYLLTFY